MKRLLLCFLIILAAIACKKPAHDPGNSGSAKIRINSYPDDADTIHVSYYSILQISTPGADFPKYALRVFTPHLTLDDSSNDGTFRVRVQDLFYSLGQFDCLFEVYGGSSNQTYQQIIHDGTFISKRQVVIHSYGYSHIPQPDLEERNGTLEGTFDTILDLKALAVYKSYNAYDPDPRVDSVTAVGAGEFVFTDNSYVGEEAFYWLKGYSLNDTAGLSFSADGSGHKAIDIKPHEVFSDANGWPVIRWYKNRYYQNFGSYRIRKQKYYGNSTIIKEITDINDTVQSGMDLGFPGPINIYVTHLPKVNLQLIRPYEEMEHYGFMVTYKPGNPIQPFDEMGSPLGNDIYIHEDDAPYLYRFNAATIQHIDSISCSNGRFSVSPNNRYVLTMRDGRFHLYDVSNGQYLSVLISDYLPPEHVNEFVAADNGTMAVVNDFDNVKLIDVLHNQLLGTLPLFNYTLNICKISQDGQYVFVFTDDKYRIYRYSGGTFTEVINIDSFGFMELEFIPDQPGRILLISKGKYEIINLQTGNVELSIPLNLMNNEISIDFNNYLIMADDDYFYRIYDINTGNLVKSIIHNLYESSPHLTYLHGRTLFYGSGTWITF